MRFRWLCVALILSAALAALHIWAVSDFLYWRHEWFDVVMHFLGGLTSAVFVIGFLLHKRRALTLGLLALIFIGWEIFELMFGVPREADYTLDTVVDIVMDTLGALTAYLVAQRTIWKK